MTKHHPLVAAAFAAASLLATPGCGGSSYETTGEPPLAGAEARFEIDEITGDNAMVRVRADHLAPPERMRSGSEAYVVWFVGPGGATMAGRLDYDEGERSGEMRATSPHESFTVRVTAEPNANVAAPSRAVVFEQRVSR